MRGLISNTEGMKEPLSPERLTYQKAIPDNGRKSAGQVERGNFRSAS
jgi:hypothetical protein